MSARGAHAIVLLALAGGSAFVWTALALRVLRGSRRIPRLPDVAPEAPPGGWPSVSVIVPSRNEERAVEAATRGLLAQDYPSLEVVAIDDRSTDATGRLLDALAARDERLAVRHITALPHGWLGKNYAMAQGAEAATGEWLLFTDGDVLFAPDVVRRAMAFACRHHLGHLVAFPHLIAPGFLERAFVASFALFANLVFQVWDLKRPGSRAFVGVGAFSLVRREAYAAVGGHRAVAFEVVDDAKLGLILRRSGVPQGALDSGGLVRVRWQQGFVASLNGLNKNAFAALEWSVPRALGFALALPVFTTVPLVIADAHGGCLGAAGARGQRGGGSRVPVVRAPALGRGPRQHGHGPAASRHRLARHVLPTGRAAPRLRPRGRLAHCLRRGLARDQGAMKPRLAYACPGAR